MSICVFAPFSRPVVLASQTEIMFETKLSKFMLFSLSLGFLISEMCI